MRNKGIETNRPRHAQSVVQERVADLDNRHLGLRVRNWQFGVKYTVREITLFPANIYLIYKQAQFGFHFKI